MKQTLNMLDQLEEEPH